jgi:hypothetical protein
MLMNRGHAGRLVPALLLAGSLVAGSYVVARPLGVHAQTHISDVPIVHVTLTGGTGSPTAARLTSTTPIVQAGATLAITGYNFMAGEAVALSVNGGADQLALVHASTSGTLSARLKLPATLTSGLHLVTATGLASHVTAYLVILVTGGAAPTQGVSTAATQSSAAIMATSRTVARGGTITLSLRNFAAAEAIALSFNNAATPLTVIHAGPSGTVVVRLTIAATVAPGLKTITAVGASGQHFALVTINVT